MGLLLLPPPGLPFPSLPLSLRRGTSRQCPHGRALPRRRGGRPRGGMLWRRPQSQEQHAHLSLFKASTTGSKDFMDSGATAGKAQEWTRAQVHGTPFEIDCFEGEFSEYDEKGECPVDLSKIQSTFKVVKKSEKGAKTKFL